MKPMVTIPFAGYHFQCKNAWELGLKPVLFAKGHENFSVMGSVVFFKSEVRYASPVIGLRYFKPLFKENTGVILSASYWTSKVLGVREHRFTPEAGISIRGGLNITYGYNFPISSNELTMFTRNRIAIRIMML